jgi:hypothetical protein
MLSFSMEQHAIEGAIAFDNVDWIWASPLLHMIARRADRPTAITLGVDKACDAEIVVNALRSVDVTCRTERQRP